jgi:hypothetical protein
MMKRTKSKIESKENIFQLHVNLFFYRVHGEGVEPNPQDL